MTNNADTRQRFLFENADIRGEIVRLGTSWQNLLSTHAYPAAVQSLLGELLTSTILLSATLKYQGTLIAQIQSGDDLPLMITECNSENKYRGLAQYKDAALHKNPNEIIKQGTLALTIDPLNGDRYQGIVKLESGNISHAIEDYMRRSQQIETRIWLDVNSSSAAGILLQKLPKNEHRSHPTRQDTDEQWHKVTTFTDTVSAEELHLVDFKTLIHRLYPEDDVRLFEPHDLQFHCSCSKNKVTSMLRMLGEAELESILLEKGLISVNCEFCNKLYEFDKLDVRVIFATDVATDHSTTRH